MQVQDIVLSGSVLWTVQSALVEHGDMARQGSLHFSCRQDCLLGQSLSVVHSTLGSGTVQIENVGYSKGLQKSNLGILNAYFCCKLSHMDFLCSQSYTRILLCGFLLCSQHWWSSLHKGLHIFHSCMPSNRHIQGLRDIHIACIFHRGCLCSLACTCRLLCGSWHYIQHSGHNFQKCKGPSILCCSKLLWWDTHHQTCSRLYWKKEERAFKSTAQGPNY